MAVNKLVYNGVSYEPEIAIGSGIDMDHAMVGETLAADVLTVKVITRDLPEQFIAADMDESDFLHTADDDLFCIKGGVDPPVAVPSAPGLYYHNNTLIGKYYLYKSHQIGRHEWEMIFYSAIYLLGRSKHFGGLYSGEPVSEVLADIMGDVAYTVDDDIASIQVYGYLPYDSRRRSLQKLLMAIGGAIRNNVDGSLRVTSLSDVVTGTFGESRVFVGAEVVDESPCTAVQVTEHNFIASTQTDVLYENASISTELITFSQPYHDYTIVNGTILESGVNYVKFTGAGLVKIEGKQYIHIERIITVGDEPTGADTDNVKVISDNTLISPNNASDVAQSLYDFLSVAQSIRADVVFGSERVGDVVNVINPYTREIVKCCAKSMEIDFGFTELRARSRFLVNYIPPSPIIGFEHYVLLTGSGQWEVPEGCTKIRAVLFGAGNGGSGGYDGENGIPAEATSGRPGEGGSGGVKGSGGLIFELNLAVTPGAPFDFACGTGGDGGAKGTPGLAGGDTTFGIYSSALGRFYPDGYQEPKTGLTLGADGDPGVAGGRGSAFQTAWPVWENDVTIPGPSIAYKGITYTPGANGANEISLTYNTYGFGGRGGGAAAGANGGNGGNITIAYVSTYGSYVPTGGSGGNGADAVDADDAENYGQGGHGGHGGGGGGHNLKYPSSYPGQGGSGSAGGKGGDGCIVIYY